MAVLLLVRLSAPAPLAASLCTASAAGRRGSDTAAAADAFIGFSATVLAPVVQACKSRTLR